MECLSDFEQEKMQLQASLEQIKYSEGDVGLKQQEAFERRSKEFEYLFSKIFIFFIIFNFIFFQYS